MSEAPWNPSTNNFTSRRYVIDIFTIFTDMICTFFPLSRNSAMSWMNLGPLITPYILITIYIVLCKGSGRWVHSHRVLWYDDSYRRKHREISRYHNNILGVGIVIKTVFFLFQTQLIFIKNILYHTRPPKRAIRLTSTGLSEWDKFGNEKQNICFFDNFTILQGIAFVYCPYENTTR